MAFSSENFLLSETELLNDGAVAIDVLLLEIVQKIAALTYHLKKTAARVVVVVVEFQVLGEVGNSLGENGDLYLGRACVTLVCCVSLDDFGLYFFVKHFFHLMFFFLILLFRQTKGWLGEMPISESAIVSARAAYG